MDLAYIANLRHARNMATTALNSLEAVSDSLPDKQAEEGIKEAMQSARKVISAITNELSRYGTVIPRKAYTPEEEKKNA